MYKVSIILSFLLWIFQGEQNDFQFPEIEGFKKTGDVEIYDSDNLFDYINGAADLYLSYEFEKLQLQRYNDPNNGSLIVEIYELSTLSNTFGIYSAERPDEGKWLDIGQQGYFEKDILNFYQGRFYVKMMSMKLEMSADIMMNIANKIEDVLPKIDDKMELIGLFPEEGKISNSERYINKNFLGYESLSEAYTAKYSIDNKKFDLFIIKNKNSNECKIMLTNYSNSIGLDTIKISQGKIDILDPFLGEFPIAWINEYIVGAINFTDEKTALEYIERVIKEIK